MRFLSIFSTLVTLLFTVMVFQRYRQRGGQHLLFWGIGLLLYGLGTLTEVIMLFTFNALALKVWYICGAMLTAAWLGQGTLYLLVRKRGVVNGLTVGLIVVSLIAVGLLLSMPLTDAATTFDTSLPVSAQYKEILVRTSAVSLVRVILNIYGTITLVGGAIYSAYLFWRKQVLAGRMYGSLLIAGGALLPAMGGTAIRAGFADWLYLSEFLGAVLMFLGFLVATSRRE